MLFTTLTTRRYIRGHNSHSTQHTLQSLDSFLMGRPCKKSRIHLLIEKSSHSLRRFTLVEGVNCTRGFLLSSSSTARGGGGGGGIGGGGGSIDAITDQSSQTQETSSSSSSSSSSSAAGGGARRRNRSIIHASPPLPLGSKALPFSCQVPGCDQAGVTFPGVTESDRRSAGEAHMKSKHQEYVSVFEKDGSRVCETCGKGYKGRYARDHLSAHTRLHDSLDWKVCEFCPYSAAGNGNVKVHILICSMNPDRALQTVKCKHCNEQVGVSSMSTHLAAHHGIGKFYNCFFCDYEMYDKQSLVSHIYNNHKDKSTITSYKATREIIFADSYPFETRNGNGGGIGDVAAAPSSTESRGGRKVKRARTNNSSTSSSSS